eukprot:3940886-Rhodomonas_salina.2
MHVDVCCRHAMEVPSTRASGAVRGPADPRHERRIPRTTGAKPARLQREPNTQRYRPPVYAAIASRHLRAARIRAVAALGPASLARIGPKLA